MNSKIETTKQRLIKRQNVIYVTLVATGLLLLGASVLEIINSVAEAIAFITVGSVGLIMSLTTFDVATGIKEEIRSVGAELSSNLKEISSTQKEMSGTLKEISSTQKEMSGTLKEISSTQKEISSKQDEMSGTLKEISSKQDEMSGTLGKVLTAVNRVDSKLENHSETNK